MEKYDALPFIQSIKRFKSVELYIASLETKAPVQSGHSNSSADAGSEPTLKPEEAAGSGKPSDKNTAFCHSCFGTITHRLI
uniref:Uncharacterized protein n=1 Tax=Klebsiella pneumoniae TaxID=573 RepID=A0A8B0SVE6_KLEPN|nr:hypothetical protein [Klebsiella pneumoniae]